MVLIASSTLCVCVCLREKPVLFQCCSDAQERAIPYVVRNCLTGHGVYVLLCEWFRADCPLRGWSQALHVLSFCDPFTHLAFQFPCSLAKHFF